MINQLINWSRKHSLSILRWSMGIIFLWFGVLKLFPQPGEAEDLGYRTLHWLSGDRLGQRTALWILGLLELSIGAGLLLKKWMGLVLCLLFLQMAGTFLPLIIFPAESWDGFLKPSLAGHYIIKNLVLLSAGLVLTATAPKKAEPAAAGKDRIVKT